MRSVTLLLVALTLVLSACAPREVPTTGGTMAPARAEPLAASTLAATATAVPPTATTAPTSTSTATPSPSASPTPEPVGIIRVDTLEAERYPFPENGNCSLAEAISAANLLQPVDGCAAGVEDQTVIELAPGTYRFTQPDVTPQQNEWVLHTSPAGSALPTINRTLTLRGNGAVLSREDATEPFRLLEVLYGTFTLEDITLQGGDVGADAWGGALLVQNASVNLDRVEVKGSKAENGGGVHVSNGAVNIRDSVFSGNEAAFSGGGVYIIDARANITTSQFLENRNDGYGAGLYAERVTILLTDSIFIGNVNPTSRGGGLNIQEAEATVLRCQFYNNVAGMTGGGASFRNFIYEEDIAEAEADPMLMVEDNPYLQEYFDTIPGFRETLVAHPSGMFQSINLEIQIHDSCFQGNTTLDPEDPNWSSAIAGVSFAQNNYYGDPSGPGGMGPGKGDQVGRSVEFEPFLTQPPAHCDLSLAE